MFGAPASELVHHSLRVAIDPAARSLHAVDTITLPAPVRTLTFTLNAQFQSVSANSAGETVDVKFIGEHEELRSYRVAFPSARKSVSLRYDGTLKTSGGFDAGHLDERGVFLHRHSGWFPDVTNSRLTFSLEVTAPPGWEVVSQGAATRKTENESSIVRWIETQPQVDLYLVGGPLHRFELIGGLASAQAYLRSADDRDLAEQYLAATARYLSMYDRLLGPYAYEKFALVENFWETGYGMPSFTLLGSRVIRLPFIVHTSYPHEIVHSWWGNGVFVDYAGGNWSEGLTAYLADHLLRELSGQGAQYRRDALQKYRNYVDRTQDFALVDFVARHGDASAAVGYNKTLMLFHMLRRELGDQIFVDALRALYLSRRFRQTSFMDVARVFEDQSGVSLASFFRQWTERVGAPALALGDVEVTRVSAGYLLRSQLTQTQSGDAFELTVPLLVQTAAGVETFVVPMSGKTAKVESILSARPQRILVDPEFDIFRRLDRSETPASLGELFGAGTVAAVVPANLSEAQHTAYATFARQLGATRIVTSDELSALPDNEPVWYLGWETGIETTATTSGETPLWTSDFAEIAGERWTRGQHCVVMVVREPVRPVARVGCEQTDAFDALARKLPHYGKYSYLSFDRNGLSNRLKGRWHVVGSALDRVLIEPSALGELRFPVRPTLVEVEPRAEQ